MLLFLLTKVKCTKDQGQEGSTTYDRIRQGKSFYASKKVLGKNRHALVLGCSIFYRKDNDDENLKVDNKEYDIVEPPEPYVVPSIVAELS